MFLHFICPKTGEATCVADEGFTLSSMFEFVSFQGPFFSEHVGAFCTTYGFFLSKCFLECIFNDDDRVVVKLHWLHN